MLRLIKHLVPARARKAFREADGRRTYALRSYAQEGEDLLLLRLFGSQDRGVYVDIGAHHPFRFSNTCLLHERGWRGINVDARPGSMEAFRRLRPHDVSLELGIGPERRTLTFHVFEEPALNTFDPALAATRRQQGWPQLRTCEVPCLPLSDVLERELPRLGEAIDLLSVDVEGLDLPVLQSNDWQRFRPRVVVAEVLESDLLEAAESDVAAFMHSVGYRPYAKLVNSIFFLRLESGLSA